MAAFTYEDEFLWVGLTVPRALVEHPDSLKRALHLELDVAIEDVLAELAKPVRPT